MTEHSVKPFTREVLRALNSVGKDFSAHSIFSPSGSAMWAYCSGSLIPNLFANDEISEDTAYGSVAHGVAEQWLKSGERPDHLIGTVETIVEGEQQFDIEIDESMLDYVQEYIDWCAYLPGNHFVETRVDHSDLTPLKNQGGTADHAACEPGHLTITDLKMGKGVQVFAEKNTQAILYAYGFFKKYDELYEFQRITIRIAQPRLGHFDVWEIDREELLKWAAWLKERAFAAWCKDGERTPGLKQCQWCRIKADCAAYVVFSERLIDGVFENLDEPVKTADMADLKQRIDGGLFTLQPVPLGSLTTEQKAKLLPYRKMIESWFKDIHQDLEQRGVGGEEIPGYKIVDGKSNRVFRNDKDAVETLEFLGLGDDAIWKKKMVSPAQAENELVKVGYKRKQLPALLNQVVVKPPGKKTLVLASDPRPASESVIGNTFNTSDDDL